MSVESTGYRTWSEKLRPTWFACWPIARTGLMLVLRRKLFWVLLALALTNFLFMFATIYLKAQITVQNPGVERFLDQVLSSVTGKGKTYLEFMFAQATVTMLLLAFAGAAIVGNDHQKGGMTYYLSRRVGAFHYIVGKLLAIGMLVSLTTTLPALALFVEYGLLTDSLTYFTENYRILYGILGYGAVLSVTLSLLLFALATWMQKTVPLVMSWTFIFVMLPALGAILRGLYNERNSDEARRWLLLNLWRDLRLLGSWCFDTVRARDESQLLVVAILVGSLCVISALVSIPKVRAVKVVS